ncbi:MAG: energy transducer TonB [Nitrospiraceae bacterium]
MQDAMRLNISFSDFRATQTSNELPSVETAQTTATDPSSQELSPKLSGHHPSPPPSSELADAMPTTNAAVSEIRPIGRHIVEFANTQRVIEREAVTRQPPVRVTVDSISPSNTQTEKAQMPQPAIVQHPPETVIRHPFHVSTRMRDAEIDAQETDMREILSGERRGVESSESHRVIEQEVVTRQPSVQVATSPLHPSSARAGTAEKTQSDLASHPIASRVHEMETSIHAHIDSALAPVQESLTPTSDVGSHLLSAASRGSGRANSESALFQEPNSAPQATADHADLERPPHPSTELKTGHGQKPTDDYRWVAQALWERIIRIKQYPQFAHASRLEGVVLIRAAVKQDGSLIDIAVFKSSGHGSLDSDALDLVRRAGPLSLQSPLNRPQVVVTIPVRYKLD